MSTPIRLFGRSLTCPIDAFTVKSAPRYFLIVRAFAGDSTTTSALDIVVVLLFDSRGTRTKRAISELEKKLCGLLHSTDYFLRAASARGCLKTTRRASGVATSSQALTT